MPIQYQHKFEFRITFVNKIPVKRLSFNFELSDLEPVKQI